MPKLHISEDRRKVRSYVCDCLDAGFLVAGYGCLLSVLLLFWGLAKGFNLLIHVEHLGNVLFELRVSSVRIVGSLVRLDFMLFQNALDGGFDRFPESRMSRGFSEFVNILSQLTVSPLLCGVAIICGFGASQRNQPCSVIGRAISNIRTASNPEWQP